MHEKILQLAGNTPKPSYVPYGYSNLEEQRSSMSSSIQTNTTEEENQHATAISASLILPGTGSITHNVKRMLEDSSQTVRTQLPSTSPRAGRYSPYSTAHFMSVRHNALHKHSLTYDTDVCQEDPTSDISNSDMSISTEGSVSPKLSSAVTPPPQYGDSSMNGSSVHFSPSDDTPSSADSSPSVVSAPPRVPPSYSSNVPNTDRVNSVENNDKQPKKNARTNYTNEQVQALLKIFHETPYPDSDMMENIGKDLGISEKQVKVWFQNKRARWCRHVNDTKNNNNQLAVPPMLSPVAPYGYMPTGHNFMMTSSPLQNFPGFFNYPWMQGSLNKNNNQLLPGQILASQIPPRYQTTNQSTALQKHDSFSMNSAQLSPTMSSAEFGRTLPQQNMSNQNRHSFQYPGYMYPSTYTPVL